MVVTNYWWPVLNPKVLSCHKLFYGTVTRVCGVEGPLHRQARERARERKQVAQFTKLAGYSPRIAYTADTSAYCLKDNLRANGLVVSSSQMTV